MAGRVNSETRARILEEARRREKSAAQIARDFGVSPTTVRRIVLSGNVQPSGQESANTTKSIAGATSGMQSNDAAQTGTSREEVRILQKLRDAMDRMQGQKEGEGGESDPGLYVEEFMKWLNQRDEMEKARIQVESEIDQLKVIKGDLEKQVSDLFSRAARVESMIGRMKSQAENALEALDMAETRLSTLEDRLSIEKDVLVVATGLKWILDTGEINEQALNFISRFKRFWYPDENEIRSKLRDTIIADLENALSKLKQSSHN